MKVIAKLTGKPLEMNLLTVDKVAASGLLQRIAKGELAADSEALNLLKTQAAAVKPPKPSTLGVISVTRMTRSDRLEAFNNPAPDKFFDPDTRYVIPTFNDYGAILLKQKEVREATGIALTEAQGWALVLAELRGAHDQMRHRRTAVRRILELNNKWKTDYTERDLDRILVHLTTGTRIATNYTFSQKPGANIGCNVDSKTLAERLINDLLFRNMWEIGASQASTSRSRRGAVEESMGYGSTLRRLKGAPLHQTPSPQRRKTEEGEFAPLNNAELPKYAALVSRYQLHGVARRYGKSVIYWKERSVRPRMTHTPGDSWNIELMQGAYTSYTSHRHLDALLAYSDEILLRLAAAEATGKDKAFLNEVKQKGVSTDSYIETQVHGELSWVDAEQVVIGDDEEDAEELRRRFIQFRDRAGYDFTVTRKTPSPAAVDAPNIAAAAVCGDSGLMHQWLTFDIGGYQDSDWTEFLGAIPGGQQLEIANYLMEQCTEGLIGKLQKIIPAELLPGGRQLAPTKKSSEGQKIPKPPSPPISRSQQAIIDQARNVSAAAMLGDSGLLHSWLMVDLYRYDDDAWRLFLEALDMSGLREIGVYLMRECTEGLLKKLRPVVPAALLPGGKVISPVKTPEPLRQPLPSTSGKAKPVVLPSLLPVTSPLGSPKTGSLPSPVTSKPSASSKKPSSPKPPEPLRTVGQDGARGLLTPQKRVAEGLVRVSCLSQSANTCGQRAAYNAVAFMAHPRNPGAAATAMADFDALHRFGNMPVDIYDETVRTLLDSHGGQDIPLIWNFDRIRLLMADPTLIADDGDFALYGFMRGQRRTVSVVINTHASLNPGSLDEVLSASSLSHYIAAELHWSDTGALEISFADSLVNADGTEALLRELKRLIG